MFMGNWYGPREEGEIGPKVIWEPLKAKSKSGAQKEARLIAKANGWRLYQVATREWYDRACSGHVTRIDIA